MDKYPPTRCYRHSFRVQEKILSGTRFALKATSDGPKTPQCSAETQRDPLKFWNIRRLGNIAAELHMPLHCTTCVNATPGLHLWNAASVYLFEH
jgi:hypothetical protein